MSGMSLVGGLIGGLGLFLLGRWMATEGLKVVGGGLWRENRRNWTRDRRRCFELGLALVLFLPSWRALHPTALGLVSSRGVRLREALWITAGSGFGAVATAWLIVAIGFHSGLLPVALGILAVGVVLRRSRPETPSASWGGVLIGAGILFLGLRMFVTAVEGIDLQLETIALSPGARVLGGALIGGLLAVAVTSASGATALIVIAAGTGKIDASTAAALLVGGNLGAVICTLPLLRGSRTDSRRVIVGYLAFLGLGFAAGLLLLRCGLPLVELFIDYRGGPLLPLAVFHTLFCGVGALLLAAIDVPLVRALQDRLGGEDEAVEGSSRLDLHLIGVPDLALEGLLEELAEIRKTTLRLGRAVLGSEPATSFRRTRFVQTIGEQVEEMDAYVARLVRGRMPGRVGDLLLDVAQGSRAYLDIGQRLAEMQGEASGEGGGLDGRLIARLRQLRFSLLHLLQNCDPLGREFSVEACRGELGTVEEHCRGIRMRLLVEGTATDLPTETLERVLEGLIEVEDIGRKAVSAAGHLARIHAVRRGETAAGEGGEVAEEMVTDLTAGAT
jgi:phosphate:Na+ symporter